MRLLRHSWALCVAAAAQFVAMTALEFLYFRRLSGGLASLDTRMFGFGAEEGMEWLTALGPTGREAVMVWHYLTFDLVFPLLSGAALASLVLASGSMLKGFAALPVRLQNLVGCVLVAPYVIADYAQNVAVGRLLSDSLEADPSSLALASALVVAKFAFLAVPVAIIAAFALAGYLPRRQAR